MSEQKPNLSNAIHDGIWLTAVIAGVWLLACGPMHLWKGTAGLEGLSYAAVLCLVPGWLVILACSLFKIQKQSSIELFLPLGGTFLRLAFVMGGVLLIRQLRPELGLGDFLAWVVVFYLVALAAETRILLKSRQTASQQVDTDTVSGY